MNSNETHMMVDNEHDLEMALKAKQKVVALIYASWCPFCLRFLPVFEKKAFSNPGDFLAVLDDREIVADRYAVEVVPTVLYFENGIVSGRLDGILGVGLNETQLQDFIDSCNLPG